MKEKSRWALLEYWPSLSVQPILNQVGTLSDKVRTLTVENNVMKDEVKESKAKVSQLIFVSIVCNVCINVGG